MDIVNLLAAGKGGVEGQVSSSKVRNALNCGQMQQVAESLGRPYRLVAEVTQEAVQLDPVQSHLRSSLHLVMQSHHIARANVYCSSQIDLPLCMAQTDFVVLRLVLMCRIPLRSLLNQPPMYDQAYQVTISAADAFMAGMVIGSHTMLCNSFECTQHVSYAVYSNIRCSMTDLCLCR